MTRPSLPPPWLREWRDVREWWLTVVADRAKRERECLAMGLQCRPKVRSSGDTAVAFQELRK